MSVIQFPPSSTKSLRVKTRCEAVVLETTDLGRCRLLSVDGEAIPVPADKAGRLLVKVHDVVMADIMDDGTARIAYVITDDGNCVTPTLRLHGQSARWELPEGIERLLLQVDANSLVINREGVQVSAGQIQLTSEGRLVLSGQDLTAEIEDLCTFEGREIHLN